MRSAENRSSGFTLIEALVAIALFGVLMIGVFTAFASNNNVLNRGLSRAEAHQNARVSLDQLSRELRMAGYDLSGVIDGLTAPTAVQTAESDRLSFVSDLDRDGTLDRVTYRLSGDQLLREFSSWSGGSFTTPSTSVMATGLSSLNLTYLDDAQPSNATISAPVSSGSLGDIRRVTVELTTASESGREQGEFALFVDIKIRN